MIQVFSVSCLRLISSCARIFAIVLMLLVLSGVPALVNAATHDHTDECSECGSSDPSSCPPGPLCPCAPHMIAAQRVAILIEPLPVAQMQPSTAAPDTRLPPSITGEGVFHPPRHLA
jgi:hypothetical protein